MKYLEAVTDDLVTEGLLVVCNWRRKGDWLLRNGRSKLATSSYKTALLKLESLNPGWDHTLTSGTFEGYSAEEATKILRFNLQASVAASLLRSQKYKNIVQWVDDVMKHRVCPSRCTHKYSDCDYYGCWPNTSEKNKDDEAKAHYCYSLALMQTGDISRAIQQMEKALEFDPGDGRVLSQLLNLRRKAEKETLKRERGQLKNGGVEN